MMLKIVKKNACNELAIEVRCADASNYFVCDVNKIVQTTNFTACFTDVSWIV
jgi:hypothetical protein